VFRLTIVLVVTHQQHWILVLIEEFLSFLAAGPWDPVNKYYANTNTVYALQASAGLVAQQATSKRFHKILGVPGQFGGVVNCCRAPTADVS
jgi:hypothetical protein